jgi:hypothetical protein
LPTATAASPVLATADILLTLEKGRDEIHKSPWGYLLNIRKL